jgi:hypothetical protein
LQDTGGLLKGPFNGLDQGDTIVGVSYRLGKATHLSVEAGADSQAGGVVSGAVDAHTGGQPLEGTAQLTRARVHGTLSVDGLHIGVNKQTHFFSP